MRIGSAIAIYLLFWMLTLFAVLPWGVRTSDEAGTERVSGEADSAPANPMLWRKAAWTTAIATPLFALFYANYVAGWVTMDSF
jgi:predicted secreted protein